MRIKTDPQYDWNDLLIEPKRSTLNSRSEVDITREFTFKWAQHGWVGCPIIAANMTGVGSISMAKVLTEYGMLTSLHKYYSVDELQSVFAQDSPLVNNIIYTLGIRDDDVEKFNRLKKQVGTIKTISIDVPSAYIERYVDFVKMFREQNSSSVIIAGNVVTEEMTEALILAGADVVKVGIGSGAHCLTRRVAGVGVPQASAVMSCADAAHGLGGHIISDGGIVHPGDVGKAFGAGADFVMIGTIFAGHEENEGDFIYDKDGNKAGMSFHGMSSHQAQMKYVGEIKSYRASEGRETVVRYKGSIHQTIQEYLGGLRSTMTYIGARKLKHIPKRTTFRVVHRQLNTMMEEHK